MNVVRRKKIDKDRAALLKQLEQIKRQRPDVYDQIMVVWGKCQSLPENKQAEFLREATPILLKYIR